MNPRLRIRQGFWWCGLVHMHPIHWTCAPTPAEAYALWARRRPA